MLEKFRQEYIEHIKKLLIITGSFVIIFIISLFFSNIFPFVFSQNQIVLYEAKQILDKLHKDNNKDNNTNRILERKYSQTFYKLKNFFNGNLVEYFCINKDWIVKKIDTKYISEIKKDLDNLSEKQYEWINKLIVKIYIYWFLTCDRFSYNIYKINYNKKWIADILNINNWLDNKIYIFTMMNKLGLVDCKTKQSKDNDLSRKIDELFSDEDKKCFAFLDYSKFLIDTGLSFKLYKEEYVNTKYFFDGASLNTNFITKYFVDLLPFSFLGTIKYVFDIILFIFPFSLFFNNFLSVFLIWIYFGLLFFSLDLLPTTALIILLNSWTLRIYKIIFNFWYNILYNLLRIFVLVIIFKFIILFLIYIT